MRDELKRKIHWDPKEGSYHGGATDAAFMLWSKGEPFSPISKCQPKARILLKTLDASNVQGGGSVLQSRHTHAFLPSHYLPLPGCQSTRSVIKSGPLTLKGHVQNFE